MTFKLLSKKLVKPFTPTPHNLRHFRISLIDELAVPSNFCTILYYDPLPHPENSENFVTRLEDSLAQVLSEFYLFAGRYVKESRFVECSDLGVEFQVVESDCKLVDLPDQSLKSDLLNLLVARKFHEADGIYDPLLSIQITEFQCGGLTVGISISHRIADATTLSTFIDAWSRKCRAEDATLAPIHPDFSAPTLFPIKDVSTSDDGLFEQQFGAPSSDVIITDEGSVQKIVTRRFLFGERAISALRAKITGNSRGNALNIRPSKVQLVSAVIWRALVHLDRAKNGHHRPSAALLAVNFRERTVPPMPKHSCGNLATPAIARWSAVENQTMEIQGSWELIQNAIKETWSDCQNLLVESDDRLESLLNSFGEAYRVLSSSESHVVVISSWCRLRFYEADFGFGRPTWVNNLQGFPMTNCVLLMESKEGEGIEAWVKLEEKDFSSFEADDNIQSFATFN